MSLPSLLRALGTNQNQLAQKTGITQQRINAWAAWYKPNPQKAARNPKRMSLESAARCASALDITIDEFYEAL